MSDYPISNRFRVFREHKFIIHLFTDLLQQLATVDFSDKKVVQQIQQSIQSLAEMLYAHADYEESRLLKPLFEKEPTIMAVVKTEHQQHDGQFESLLKQCETILAETVPEKCFELGYRLTLDFRKVFAEMLLHLDYEERIIMPALQKWLTDAEIKSVEHDTYARMTAEQMVGMMHALIPHFNPDDRKVFLLDMMQAQREKFMTAWPKMKTALPAEEVSKLEECF